MSATILIVEDEKSVVDLIRGYLDREGFEVHVAQDGSAAIELAERLEPEIIVLDWMLPGLDGLEVLARLRRFSNAYVIMLTARVEEVDRIVGLSSGADDYLTKPFSPGELVARIRAMLRRPRIASGAEPQANEPEIFEYEGLVVDLAGREVRLDGEPVSLTVLEFDLLSTLASRPGFVFSRSRLLEQVWGDDYFGADHVVDVHMGNLRRKLSDDPSEPRFIHTVRGIGYRFARR